MEFRRVVNYQPAVEYLSQTLRTHLHNGERVTWLLTGGSGIALETAVSQQLAELDLTKLTVMLTDERFGPVGHADSNWQQLRDAGFTLIGAHMLPVLTGKDLAETVNDFGANLEMILQDADYKIGLFGMGADGHTAGILPESPAVHDPAPATGYSAGTFTRLTMTPKMTQKLDEAVLAAFGEAKRPALKSLHSENLSLDKQPAQVLKQVPKCTVFTDQIGEE